MKLKSLKIVNFRNCSKILFKPDKNINILYGKNGSGKTNLVEAIYMLSLTKSFRQMNDKYLIQNGKEFTTIEGIVATETDKNTYKLIIEPKGKTVNINKSKINLLSDYISRIQIVLFHPNDLRIIKDTPSVRRKYLNIEISQFDKKYLLCLSEYNKLLKQRNAYLKQLSVNSNSSSDYLEILTENLIKKGISILKFREEYFNNLNSYVDYYYQQISKVGKLKLNYHSHYKEKTFDEILKLYQKNYNKELNFGKTLIGVHLDDFDILLEEKNIRDFGSEGQQKNSIIALKFAEIKFISEIKNTKPILILDDIFSELDKEKINNIIKIIPDDIQTFITTTELSRINQKLLNKSVTFKVSNGMIEEDFKHGK